MKTVLICAFLLYANFEARFSGPNEIPKHVLHKVGYDMPDISKTIGALMLVPNKNHTTAIKLYNLDGSIWKKITIDGSNSKNTNAISPLYIDTANSLLYFSVLKKSGDFYTVIDNENNGEEKCIRANDPAFKLITWQAYILGCAAVQFDAAMNPIKSSPRNDALTLPFEKDEFYLPVKISGDWLQVQWGDNSKWKYGWVHWRTGGQLSLQLFNDL